MAPLTTRKQEAVKELIEQNNAKLKNFWNDQYWTNKQIQRYFQLKASELQQQILGDASDSQHEDLDIEKI